MLGRAQDIVKALGEPAAAAVVLHLGAGPTADLLKAMGVQPRSHPVHGPRPAAAGHARRLLPACALDP
jgi:hypothetical protein